MAQTLLNRLPLTRDIIPVYAVIAFLIQAWTIGVFFGQLASFSSFLSISEILTVFAYRIAESFVECLLVLGILIMVAFILPARSFRNVFVVRGTAIALSLLGSIILFWKRFETDPGVLMADYIQIWTVVALLLASLVSYASTKIISLSDFFNWFSERMVVFLYILLPLSVISIIVVLIRNIE